MDNYCEREVVELLKEFGREFTWNVNSDKWYSNWIKSKQDKLNICHQAEQETAQDAHQKKIL